MLKTKQYIHTHKRKKVAYQTRVKHISDKKVLIKKKK